MVKFLKVTAAVTAVIMVFLAGAGLIYYFSATEGAAFDDGLLPSESVRTVILDSGGEEIDKDLKCETLNQNNLPKDLVNAFVALEDKRFFEHKGVDYYRIFGAAVSNLKARSFAQGASTISQQLIKNTHLSQEKTVKRKLKEIKLVGELEKNYNKNQILAMYLNVAYFGNGIYGAGEASKEFFNKSCGELTVEECAVLAAVVKSPGNYSPLKNYDKCLARRNLVLSLMQQQGYIDESQLESAKNSKIVLNRLPKSIANVYVSSVIAEAANTLNITVPMLKSSGYTIETFYDGDLQFNIASIMAADALYAKNSYGNRADGAGLVADNTTAGITAYYSTNGRKLNELKRQPGSTVKPLLVYGPAFEENYISPATPILDDFSDFKGYRPSNYNDAYYGWVSVRTAIKKSLNVPAVKVLDYMGTETAFDYAAKMGLPLLPQDNNLNLALGGLTEGINFAELAGGYMTLANYGGYTRPTFIKTIYSGNKLVFSKNTEKTAVFSSENAYLITSILLDTAKDGTARNLASLPYAVAAKTGTVAYQGVNRDAFNVSYTTEHTLVVWHGNTDYKEQFYLPDEETGGSYATLTARHIWSGIYNNGRVPVPFRVPEGIITVELDKSAYASHELLLAATDAPYAECVFELFNQKNAPAEYSLTYQNFKPEIAVDNDGTRAAVTFTAKPQISYEIYKDGLFGTQLLETVSQTEGPVERLYDLEFLDFFSQFYVRAYYVNRYGQKVYAE